MEACLACPDRWMAALNRYDATGMDVELHFPHARFAEGTLTVLDKPAGNVMNLFDRLKRDSVWHHSAWNKREIVQRNEVMVNMAVNYTRFCDDVGWSEGLGLTFGQTLLLQHRPRQTTSGRRVGR